MTEEIYKKTNVFFHNFWIIANNHFIFIPNNSTMFNAHSSNTQTMEKYSFQGKANQHRFKNPKHTENSNIVQTSTMFRCSKNFRYFHVFIGRWEPSGNRERSVKNRKAFQARGNCNPGQKLMDHCILTIQNTLFIQ